jgi:hypothetical protein
VDRGHFWPATGGDLAYADMPLSGAEFINLRCLQPSACVLWTMAQSDILSDHDIFYITKGTTCFSVNCLNHGLLSTPAHVKASWPATPLCTTHLWKGGVWDDYPYSQTTTMRGQGKRHHCWDHFALWDRLPSAYVKVRHNVSSCHVDASRSLSTRVFGTRRDRTRNPHDTSVSIGQL